MHVMHFAAVVLSVLVCLMQCYQGCCAPCNAIRAVVSHALPGGLLYATGAADGSIRFFRVQPKEQAPGPTPSKNEMGDAKTRSGGATVVLDFTVYMLAQQEAFPMALTATPVP